MMRVVLTLVLLASCLPLSFAFVPPSTRCTTTTTTTTVLLHATTSDKQVERVFSKEFTDSIAKDVTRRVNLPFVPAPIISYILKQAVGKLSTDLSRDTLVRLQEVLQTEATANKMDDLSKDELNALADQIASELNPAIDVPLLDEDQEEQTLQQIMRIVFSVICFEDPDLSQQILKTNIAASRDLLSNDPEKRQLLVAAINKAVDIPILDEDQELSLIANAVDSSADMLQSMLPPDMLETLKGETPESIGKMKEYVITTANEKLNIVGLSEEQERSLIETMVSILIDTYVDDADSQFLLMSAEEQLAKLIGMKETLERKQMFSQRAYEREQERMAIKMERLDSRIKVLGKKKRSWFGWLRRRG